MFRLPEPSIGTTALIVAILAVAAFLWVQSERIALENRVGLKEELAAIDASRALVIDETDWVVGDPDASVVLVEYFDLECPFCKSYNDRRPYIENRFKERGVAFVSRHFPLQYLHKQALEEAVALECVGMLKGPEAFFTYRDAIYGHSEGDDTLDLSLLPHFAELLGIPQNDFAACVAGEEAKGRVSEDMMVGARVGVYGTPSLLLYKDGRYQHTITGGSFIGWRNVEVALESLLKE